ncbi:MAG: cytochrome C, partial [Alphaproteobacteria bacterium]
FEGTKFKHDGITTGCATCHYVGGSGTPKSNSHIPTNQPCETCHTSTTSFEGTRFKHDGITTGCATCHYEGGSGTPKSNSHIPTSQPCETCHRSTTDFENAKMSHTGISSNCKSCHNGVYEEGAPRDHTGSKATKDCGECHSTRTWDR